MEVLMRVLAITALFICILTISFAQFVFSEDKSNYPWLVNGLNQFPLGFEIPDDSVLATVVGGGGFGGNPVDGTLTINLKLVTSAGVLMQVDVFAEAMTMSLWKHEVMPEFGKYQFWQPVLIVPRKKDGSGYRYYEIRFEGRFFAIMDKEEINKVVCYKNDVFRKPL